MSQKITILTYTVGSQCIENKVGTVALKLSSDWFSHKMSDDKIRVQLKQALFKYPSSAVSFCLPDVKFFKRNRPSTATTTPTMNATETERHSQEYLENF